MQEWAGRTDSSGLWPDYLGCQGRTGGHAGDLRDDATHEHFALWTLHVEIWRPLQKYSKVLPVGVLALGIIKNRAQLASA